MAASAHTATRLFVARPRWKRWYDTLVYDWKHASLLGKVGFAAGMISLGVKLEQIVINVKNAEEEVEKLKKTFNMRVETMKEEFEKKLEKERVRAELAEAEVKKFSLMVTLSKKEGKEESKGKKEGQGKKEGE